MPLSEIIIERLMETKDPNQIRAILDRSPRSNVRLYEIVEYAHELEEHETHVYINKSAILFVTWAIMLWAEKTEDLIPLLKYIPTDHANTELFSIENRFIPFLEEHVAPIQISHDCYIWTLDELKEETTPLDSLTLKDAEFVNDNWDHKDQHSLEFIQHCIESMPTSCIRNKEGQPIGMAFCYSQSPDYINIGGFKVLPEYRRQGLGKRIHLDICKKVLAQKRKPLAHIEIDNLISQRICQNTNFKRNERVFWGKFSA